MKSSSKSLFQFLINLFTDSFVKPFYYKIVFFVLILVGSTEAMSQDLVQWQEELKKLVQTPIVLNELPDYDYLGPWRVTKDFAVDTKPIEDANIDPQKNCPLQKAVLYPSHPQQTTKNYHAALTADYLTSKLPADSVVCLIPTVNKKYCLRSTKAHSVIMSDLYWDQCHNLYRAFWITSYPQSFENMGTLFAKGRVIFQNQNSPIAGDVVDGSTYPVDQGEFISITKASNEDFAISERYRADSLKSGRFILKDLLFIEK